MTARPPQTRPVGGRGALAARADLEALAAGLVTVALWGSAFVAIRAAGRAFSRDRWRSAGCW